MNRLGMTIAALMSASSVWAVDETVCMPESLDDALRKDRGLVRVATFNAYLNRSSHGQLIADLSHPDDQVTPPDAFNPAPDLQTKAVAEIIQRVRPDIVLLNEFDFDPNGVAVSLLQSNFLGVSQNGQQPIHYDYVFLAESNTGIPSGLDLNNDNTIGGPDDAFGFGTFPGQYGTVLLSKLPIDERASRTFQTFLWKDMPDNLIPGGFYTDDELNVLRLSSKSHWDVVIKLGHRNLHVLAAHPTPPVFDGPEDRTGTRNHDEIRFWSDYIGGRKSARYIIDDRGVRGGLQDEDPFVIVGDYNADPFDGDSTDQAILQLLEHPAIDTSAPPASFGGVEDSALAGGLNDIHTGNPAFDTGDFNPATPGNLRVDYVLPSKRGVDIVCGGVFWPQRVDDTRPLVGEGFPVVSSDHHLVWQDLVVAGYGGGWDPGDHRSNDWNGIGRWERDDDPERARRE